MFGSLVSHTRVAGDPVIGRCDGYNIVAAFSWVTIELRS